jgi:hypothetical protein
MAFVSMRKTPFRTGMPQTTAQSDTVQLCRDYSQRASTVPEPECLLCAHRRLCCVFANASGWSKEVCEAVR